MTVARTRTTSRRDLLKLGALAGGGLALGIALPGCGSSSDSGRGVCSPGEAVGEFRPNAWLRIQPDDRIVFVLDRVEMGQGTMTSHATLLAEELEVAVERIEIVLAPVDRVYANPEPEFLGMQGTAGSSSMRGSWEPLRRAGATAREMLRRAAAARWCVSLDECEAREGAIHHLPTARTARYGALAGAASSYRVDDVRLKTPAEFRLIGTSVARLDAPMKSNGSAAYALDVKMPNLLTAVLVRPTVRGARAQSVDASAARARPGVLDVFTLEQGVAVLASTYWQARRAAEDVKIVWQGGDRALASDALRTIYGELLSRPGSVARNDGDVDGAFARASVTIEATYDVPFLAHAPMEPPNCTAHVTGERCEIWAPTQSPDVVQLAVSRALGRSPSSVVVHTMMPGGSFGRYLTAEAAVEAALVSMRSGQPVKVIWSREDDMANDNYRPMAMSYLRGGVDATGHPCGLFARLASQQLHAPEGFPFPVPLLDGRGLFDLTYAIADLRVEYAASPEYRVPYGDWRSVAFSYTGFFAEAFLDELAQLGRQDPLELRRSLLVAAPRQLAVLELAATKAGWRTPLPTGMGRGIAAVAAFHGFIACVVEVEWDGRNVRVHRVVAAIDCGFVVNPNLVRAQIEGGIVFGLSAALHQRITFEGGAVVQSNFHDFPLLRYHECPIIEVHLMPSSEPPSGCGEMGVPAVAPALCSAIFAASGRRIRSLPISLALKEHA